MVTFNSYFIRQQTAVCCLILLCLCIQSGFAQQPRRFYIQTVGSILYGMPNHTGETPKGYLKTPLYEGAGFLSGSGIAFGCKINHFFGAELSYQQHEYMSSDAFGLPNETLVGSGGGIKILEGTSWGLRTTFTKHLRLQKIGLGDWYVQGFVGLFVVSTDAVVGKSMRGGFVSKFYNVQRNWNGTTADTLTMFRDADILKSNFLNGELGIRIEKNFEKRFGVFATMSHSFGFSPFYQESIKFKYNQQEVGSINRSYSGSGIYFGIGLRYYFDLPFLEKKKKATQNQENNQEKTTAPPTKKRKSNFIFRIF